MRIALAQMNSLLGDFSGNLQKALSLCEQAQEKNCQLIVFPELALLGYSPNDLLERPEIIGEHKKALQDLYKKKPKRLDVLIGGLSENKNKNEKGLFNSAFLLQKKISSFNKELLPSYDVFDETRFFASGKIIEHLCKIQGRKVLVLICEDMWSWERREHQNAIRKLKKSRVDLVVSINASPFALGKQKRRLAVAKQTAKYLSAPVIYVNMVGGQDELIFDGSSFAIDASGRIQAQSAFCSEDLNVIDLDLKKGGVRQMAASEAEQLHSALVLGLRDFARKNRFEKIHLGLSGGIDSAVALALAADAVGPQNVLAVAMPGPFSTEKSFQLAQQLAKNIGCRFKKIDIQASYNQHVQNFEEAFGKIEFGLVHENIQARLRGQYLMMIANHENSLLLATGNKSEFATGYTTLYGDMCGGLAPLGDLLKKQVYQLAKLYNQQYELIPQEIIDRAPSAELRPNQKDQDSLPPYDELDRAVEKMVVSAKPAVTDTEKWLLKRIASSEFKRWQAPPILRVSDHAFGRGRRFPITRR